MADQVLDNLGVYGTIGIGTITPEAKLHVSDVSPGLRLGLYERCWGLKPVHQRFGASADFHQPRLLVRKATTVIGTSGMRR